MRLPTPVGDQTTPMLPFALASTTFATAASSLSKAAQAMAEVALAMSQVSEAFSTMNLSTTSTVLYNKPASDLSDKGGSDSMESPNGSSGYCGSEFEREEGDIYDDDDMMVGTPTANSSPPPDPITTLPCCSGTMDLTQLRLTPHVPVHGVPDTLDMGKLKPSPTSTDVGRAFKGATSVEPTPALVKDDSSSKLVVLIKPPAPVESVVQPKIVRPNAPTLGQIASRRATITRVTPRVIDVSSGQRSPQAESSDLRIAVEKHPRLPWGRNFIKLGDEFDAIPLISCIALGSNKTICVVPIPESLGHYNKIFHAITKINVFQPQEPHTPELVENALKTFGSSTPPCILLLPFKALAHVLLSTAKPDCVVHWGWPLDRQSYLKQITLLDLKTRSCLLIPPGEHYKPVHDVQVSSYGVVKYPETVRDSFLGSKSPLHLVRKLATEVLRNTPSSTVDALYRSWLGHYGTGTFKRSDWSQENLLEYAQNYATKVLLRDSKFDRNGASVLAKLRAAQEPALNIPVSGGSNALGELTLSSGEKKTDKPPVVAAPVSIVTNNSPIKSTSQIVLNNPADKPEFKAPATRTITAAKSIMTTSNGSTTNINPPPVPSASKKADILTPGRFFIVLEEEFDAIPLILYLAESFKRTTCYVPSSESVAPYKQLLASITTTAVIQGLLFGDAQRFVWAPNSSALLLLPSKSLDTAASNNLTSDCLIHWGLVKDFKSFTRKLDNKASCSYMLLTSEEYSKASVQKDLASHGIIKHPSHPLINRYDEESPIVKLRKKTTSVLQATSSSSIVQLLYYSFLNYHCIGPHKSIGTTPESIARQANNYAAKVLLHGDPADGSKRFKPIKTRPHVTNGIINACKLKAARDLKLLKLKGE